MSENSSRPRPHARRQWVVVPHYQKQLAMALAILQINTGLLYLGVMQFRVRDLAERAIDQREFLNLNLWMEFLPWTLGISAVVAVVAWFLGLFFSNSIVGPIPRLRRFLLALGQGDFSQRLKLRPGDALEPLSLDLNRLAIALDKRYGTIERADARNATTECDSDSEPVELSA